MLMMILDSKIKSISKFIDAGIAFSSHHKKFIEKKIPWTKKNFYVLLQLTMT